MPSDKSRSRVGPLSVCLAVATYRRPKPLAEALNAFLTVERPADCGLHVVVVDNDPDRSAEAAFRAFAEKARLPATYLVEAERGIPHARNRCLAEAGKLMADILVFIDDDETPSPQWLVRLVDHYRSTGCQLIGGPVAVRAKSDAVLSAWQKTVLRSIVAWAERKARKAEIKTRRGKRVTVVTNNWLGDLRFIAENRIAFRADLAASGGSDTAFFREAVAKGASHGWCPEAIVYDRLPVWRYLARLPVPPGACAIDQPLPYPPSFGGWSGSACARSRSASCAS